MGMPHWATTHSGESLEPISLLGYAAAVGLGDPTSLLNLGPSQHRFATENFSDWKTLSEKMTAVQPCIHVSRSHILLTSLSLWQFGSLRLYLPSGNILRKCYGPYFLLTTFYFCIVNPLLQQHFYWCPFYIAIIKKYVKDKFRVTTLQTMWREIHWQFAALSMLSVTHNYHAYTTLLVLLSVVGVRMQQCMIQNHIFNI